MNCLKTYVGVTIKVDKYGNVCPISIQWKNGYVYEIDRLKLVCKAASLKVRGGGTRYTVMIRGKERYLFQEGNKWFVEAKENTG